MDVVINGKVHTALNDGGAEKPLIKSSLLKDVSSIGSVQIQPIVGKSVEAKLTILVVAKFDSSEESVSCDSCSDCVNGPMHIVCAVTDLASQDVVLPESVVADLQNTWYKCVHLCKDNSFSIIVVLLMPLISFWTKYRMIYNGITVRVVTLIMRIYW
jgi:hypothetical protein